MVSHCVLCCEKVSLPYKILLFFVTKMFSLLLILYHTKITWVRTKSSLQILSFIEGGKNVWDKNFCKTDDLLSLEWLWSPLQCLHINKFSTISLCVFLAIKKGRAGWLQIGVCIANLTMLELKVDGQTSTKAAQTTTYHNPVDVMFFWWNAVSLMPRYNETHTTFI